MSQFASDFRIAYGETASAEIEETITYDGQSVLAAVRAVREEISGKIITREYVIRIRPEIVAAPRAGKTGTAQGLNFRVTECSRGTGGIWELKCDVQPSNTTAR